MKTVSRLRDQITSSGSPFRYLRKVWHHVGRPVESVQWLRNGARLAGSLDPEQRAIADEISRSGYAKAGGEIDTGLLGELDRFCANRLASGRESADGWADRRFMTRVTEDADLTTDHVLVRFALQEGVLKIVSAYFGQLPYLADVQIIISHGTKNEKWEESQLWHRDYADSRTVKLWVYLSDVDTPAKGPFTFLPLAESRRVKNTFFPGRVSDEAMAAAGLAEKAHAVFGPRLSTFYIETSRCYHLGSRVELGEARIAYVATFFTHASLYPFSNRIAVTQPLNGVQRMVLNA